MRRDHSSCCAALQDLYPRIHGCHLFGRHEAGDCTVSVPARDKAEEGPSAALDFCVSSRNACIQWNRERLATCGRHGQDPSNLLEVRGEPRRKRL